MFIGINATAAIKQQRTGVEEYVFQLLKHMSELKEAKKHRFVFYTPNTLRWPLPMWTQIRLSCEMVVKKPDVLFIPVHVLPLVHPKKSVVTIHGLEHEYYPEHYSPAHRKYLTWSTKYALKKASKIIAVSENTKKDLVKIYGGDPKKIEVVWHGISFVKKSAGSKKSLNQKKKNHQPYLLYIGRVETKKNIQGLIKSFEILKKKYKIPHKLFLVGCPGYGYEIIKKNIVTSGVKNSIIETGFVGEDQKWKLLAEADVFVFPSFYEGFGMPVLEAQAAGVPVVASDNSCLPEVLEGSAMLVNNCESMNIADGIFKIISDEKIRKHKIKQGFENIKRFSWKECAQKTLDVLKSA